MNVTPLIHLDGLEWTFSYYPHTREVNLWGKKGGETVTFSLGLKDAKLLQMGLRQLRELRKMIKRWEVESEEKRENWAASQVGR